LLFCKYIIHISQYISEFLNFICILAGYSVFLPLFCLAFLWNLPDFAKQAKLLPFKNALSL